MSMPARCSPSCSKLRRLIGLIGLGVFLAATGAEALAANSVLFDLAEREAELAAMSEEAREALCDANRGSWRSHKAITTVRDSPEYGIDERAEPFAHTVMDATAEAFGVDNGVAREHLVGVLNRWADGRALTKLRPPSASAHYAVERVLLPTIAAYSLVHDAPEMSAGNRERIYNWIDGLVERSRERRANVDPDRRVADNNHSYLNASVIMAWAAFNRDFDGLQIGVEAFRDAIDAMRDDGSLPLETERGGRALWYQRHAIASLVTLAEIAAANGIDLYAVSDGDQSLHRAIAFLLDGIEEPAIVEGYAAANVNPPPGTDPEVQDLGFLEWRGHGRHYMAWVEPYIRRFPEHRNAVRLRALLDLDALRPLVDDYSGGSTTCFYALPIRQSDSAVAVE